MDVFMNWFSFSLIYDFTQEEGGKCDKTIFFPSLISLESRKEKKWYDNLNLKSLQNEKHGRKKIVQYTKYLK